MKTWSVGAEITISVFTTVKAETESDALEIAAERSTAQPHFNYDDHESEWVCGDLDGMPDKMEAIESEPSHD